MYTYPRNYIFLKITILWRRHQTDQRHIHPQPEHMSVNRDDRTAAGDDVKQLTILIVLSYSTNFPKKKHYKNYQVIGHIRVIGSHDSELTFQNKSYSPGVCLSIIQSSSNYKNIALGIHLWGVYDFCQVVELFKLYILARCENVRIMMWQIHTPHL